MSKYIAWIDVESTGLDPVKCDVVQIALLIEENSEIVEEANIKLRPYVNCLVEDAALQVIDKTREEISHYPSPIDGIYQFKKILENYVSPYDKREKLFFAGYNPSFDISMLYEAFKKNNDKYFFSWFFSCFIDVRSTVGEYFYQSDIVLDNYKLGTVCGHFGIDFKAHDAMEDIRATRDLYYGIKGELAGANHT